MLEECQAAETTSAGNYKHPTYPDCLKWVVQSWAKLDTAGVRKAAKRLGMTADPGPIIQGYVKTVRPPEKEFKPVRLDPSERTYRMKTKRENQTL